MNDPFIMKALIVTMSLLIIFGLWAIYRLLKENREKKKLAKWNEQYWSR